MQKFKSSLFAACVVATLATVSAGASAQQAFKSPEEAADALVAAVRAGDAKAINKVLGPGGAAIVSSGDKVQDANSRKLVLAAYDVKHTIIKDKAGRAFLAVGADEYPLPIPVVAKDGAWRFDTASGREEILYRRIGRNELATIQALLAYVDAQNDYAEMAPNGGVGNFAQRIVSRPGKKDGLYWPAAAGEKESPLGEAVAAATLRGYRAGSRAPFHGYYYKILTRQGPTAVGGAMNYIANGRMIGGFAAVAYPAQYGNSGVKTFVVNHNGDVFEKDLGPGTAQIAAKMASFNPDRTWTRVEVVDTPEKK